MQQIKEQKNSLLQFWKKHYWRFPVLSEVARSIFGTRTSTDHSERDLACDQTLTNRRSSLAADTGEGLQVMYSAAKHRNIK